MAARVGASLQLQLYEHRVGKYFSKEFNELRSKLGLGLGWLRAVAHGYSYSHNEIDLVSNFQRID